jgi:putative membrane protein insertion efficiency factor
MKFFLIIFIRTYQLFVSPLFPISCRFQPTCSNYAIGALQKYGVLKGSNKAVRRLLRCHPFSRKHGWDPA